MQKRRKKRRMLIMSLVMMALLLIGMGATYSFFSYSGIGKKEVSIQAKGITFKYLESNRELSLNDAMPMTDEQGMAQDNYFDFEVSGLTTEGVEIPYYITARKSANSSNIDEAIKVGLTQVDYRDADVYDYKSNLGMYSLDQCNEIVPKLSKDLQPTCTKIRNMGDTVTITTYAVLTKQTGFSSLEECQSSSTYTKALSNMNRVSCDLENGTYTLNNYGSTIYTDLARCESKAGSGTCITLFEKDTQYDQAYYAINAYNGHNYNSLEECQTATNGSSSKVCGIKYEEGSTISEKKILISNYNKLLQYVNENINLSNHTEKTLYQTRINADTNYKQKYRLRMWIDYDTDFMQSKYQNAIFSLKVNVYSNGEVDSNKELADLSALEFVSKMGAGWNLGNSLDAMNLTYKYGLDAETKWDNPVVTQELIDTVKAAGFKTIRIPVSYENHLDANKVIDPQWFNRVEQVINYALNNDMYVIINVHHDTGLDAKYKWISADPSTYATDSLEFVNLWQQIATRFASLDHRVVFEAMNEIIDTECNLSNTDAYSVVHDLNQLFIDTVRSTGGNNADRFLALGTYGASYGKSKVTAAMGDGFSDTIDSKLMLAVHVYSTNISSVDTAFEAIADSMDKFNIPMYVGEYGIQNSVDQTTRLQLLTEYVTKANEIGVPLIYWDGGNANSHNLIDRTTNTVSQPETVAIIMGE